MMPREDRSTHPTVVEYAAREMMKGKTPLSAAKVTAKKLGGSHNLFLGPVIPLIDEKTLEKALWDRCEGLVIENLGRMKPGKEDFALGAVVDLFDQKPAFEKELKKRVVRRLGRDPFPVES